MNYLHSRKPWLTDFSASMKMITELIELYLAKLQFMVVIKTVHFVFFYQYSTSFICSVYCISLSIASYIFFHLYIYIYKCMYMYMYACIYIYVVQLYVCVCLLFLFSFSFSAPFSHFSYSYIYLFSFFALFQYFIAWCLIIHS